MPASPTVGARVINDNRLSRRQWLAAVPGVVALTHGLPARAEDSAYNGAKKGKLHGEFPSQDPAVVREVVGASHTRIERVRELVEASPALAKAAWDWGFGDWESALGAASHMGRVDIAELLMSHGARPDIFTFAMMGRVDARYPAHPRPARDHTVGSRSNAAAAKKLVRRGQVRR